LLHWSQDANWLWSVAGINPDFDLGLGVRVSMWNKPPTSLGSVVYRCEYHGYSMIPDVSERLKATLKDMKLAAVARTGGGKDSCQSARSSGNWTTCRRKTNDCSTALVELKSLMVRGNRCLRLSSCPGFPRCTCPRALENLMGLPVLLAIARNQNGIPGKKSADGNRSASTLNLLRYSA